MTTTVTVRHFASAHAAAGVAHEAVTAASVAELRQTLVDRHGARFASVLAACSLLLDGLICHDPAASLYDIREVHVLPPFAGG